MITIITPVYNSKQYLTQSINSILNQTYSDFELILVDDGSTDGSSQLCDDYAARDKRIKVIHQDNQGQAAARNRALDIAQGDYIAFVDSDDYIHPQMLAILLNLSIIYNTEIVVCGFARGSETEYPWLPLENVKAETYDGRDFLRNAVLNKTGKHWLLWDKLYKRSCFDHIRLPEGRIYEDNATVYKILYNVDKVAVTDSVLYYYFMNENSTVNQSFKRKHLDWLLVVEEIASFFADCGETDMLNWANNCYLTSLADLLRKARLNHFDKEIQKSLKDKLFRQYCIEKRKYPVNIHTYPMVIEELFPGKSRLYWLSKGIQSKLKGK